MADNTLKPQAFKLKGRLYAFTVIQLLNTDVALFADQLKDAQQQAPKLFDNAPVVLDCTAVTEADIDLDTYFQTLRLLGMVPVALQGANPLLCQLAQSKNIAILNASATHDKALLEDAEVETQAAVEVVNKTYTSPVRSGQQVVSKGGDLIITAAVSPGAELLADGNIHVYGVLRGRALAGIMGDRSARIFCQSLEAELVSIAGFYRLRDAMAPQTGACQIYLQDDHICIEPIG